MSTTKSPEFYEYYPKLFTAFFPNIDSELVKELSSAGFLYYQSLLFLDAVIDDHDITKLTFSLAFQEEAIKKLTHIFGLDSIFWKTWNQRKKEYQQAISIEKGLSLQKSTVSFSKYKNLADLKAAFGKIAIDSMYILSGSNNKQLYENLIQSHYYFSIGFQLYDDVKDFYEDFTKGQFNWGVYQLNISLSEEERKLSPQILNKLFFIRGVGQKILKNSIQYFKKAKAVLVKYSISSLWENTISDMANTISNYLDETEGYLLILEKKIELEQSALSQNSFFNYSNVRNKTIFQGLTFIESDYRKNYQELQHIMYLSKKQGFTNSSPIQVSDVFQRAMLDDCLLHIANKYALNISDYIEKETIYWINKRRKDKVGGWSYYPDVKEIAADIDDLAQILQVFIKFDKTHLISKYCAKPINIALEERTDANGGIETWIIPRKNQTKIQQKQEYCNQTLWGTGPDIEVVANFIYALHLLKDESFKSQINISLQYVARSQLKEGYWAARWYYGVYYGTYTALRALSIQKELYKKEIQQAINFIIQNQNHDGGWGDNSGSDALNTSFALLCLKLFDKDVYKKYINAGKKYLIISQNKNGSWNAVDFIRPKAGQPYQSKVLTTAFVLKALSM